MSKIRADQLLVERGLAPTRSRAQALIMAGAVFCKGQRVNKAGATLPADALVEVRTPLPYVSRGGAKLAHALQQFHLTIKGQIALDVGASTGGFTDCLLKAGAAKVYALDVGHGQLDFSLRSDPRVVVIEGTNVRYWSGDELQEPLDLVTIDVAFISLTKVLPPLELVLGQHAALNCRLIALIKPQFEAPKGSVGSGGILRDPKLRDQVVADVRRMILDLGWELIGLCPSPRCGQKGNQEYLLAAGKSFL